MIYFDNSATTKPYAAALETYTKVATHYFANPSSLHKFGQKVRDLHEEARKQVAALMSVRSEDIVFTSGGTESNNLAIKGIARAYQNRGKHILTSKIEHPSVSNVMKELEEEGFQVTYLPVTKSGQVRMEDVKEALREDTILISIMHVNNEVGSIQPIAEIGELLKERELPLFHVDNVQGFAKKELVLSQIDAMSISGHKLHGLRGTGILYKKSTVKLHPEILGGGQEFGLRSGTENTAGIVALAKAMRLSLEDFEKKSSELTALRDYLLEQLEKLDGVTVHTDALHSAPHIICFSAKNHRGEVLVHALEEKEVFVSTTSACSSRAKLESSTLHAMGVPGNQATGAIRVSLSYDNTKAEAEQFIYFLKEILQKINEVVK
ncbi:cysteine desulfurase family protein [Listeria fleischmannii]|uniref:Cysteine desulfurase n=1 Tax=Listeria fleischmannii TaxID=1069827 RepID=A0A841YB71_9LIST|nr:cysteine desulfurase family protein [Listeria fleischmannii]MBC1397506.1 cysteine desulfurase [Listeria fleischmannii]MBC1425875.1 cysteine desulfurase [Listeria fleischmannii]STY35106.1 Cysteine desulfurase [Listeria fleischmannii subsp. coloradonensis]